MSIVRKNIMNEKHCTPYCGKPCRTMPRTVFNGSQFVCINCGWKSSFEIEFIKEYVAKWNTKNPVVKIHVEPLTIDKVKELVAEQNEARNAKY